MENAIRSVTDAAWTIAPELGMLAAAALLVLAGSFMPMATVEARRRARSISIFVGAVALAVPLGLLVANWGSTAPAPDPSVMPFLRDGLARVVQLAGLLSGLGLLLLIAQKTSDKYPAEHVACLLFIVAGVNLTASASDLIALFVSLELISIPTYVLLYLSRPASRGLESTVKYFLLSVFSSALLLYGLSFLLGSAGSTNFALIEQSMREPTGMVSVAMLQVALAMVVAGLGFRIACVPFHFYAPDVFQGTSMPSAALLAIVPKLVGFVALVRLVSSVVLTDQRAAALAVLDNYGVALFAGLAILTMTVGNLLALVQTDLRRLLAYSSVAHAGYMLIGLAVPAAADAPSGPQAVLFYLLVYTLMTFGVFAVVMLLKRKDGPLENIADLRGLGVAHPLSALLLAIFLFGLTGLPPTVGFWGKFNLFLVAWASGQFWLQMLAVGLAINAAIAAWYYLRLIKTAYLDAAPEGSPVASPGLALYGATTLCAAGVVGLFFFPGTIWSLIGS